MRILPSMLALVLSFSSLVCVAEQAIPVKDFSALPEFSRPSLSPSGTKVAFINNITKPMEGAVLSTYDFTDGKKYPLVSSDNEKVKINWFRWANDNTLLVSARYESKQGSVKYYQTRLFSVPYNKIGERPKMLIKPRKRLQNKQNASQFQDKVIDFLPADPDHILVEVDLERAFMPSVYKVNVHTARMSRVLKGKLNIRNWITDQQGNVRIGSAYDYDSGDSRVYVINAHTNDYDVLFESKAFSQETVSIKGFGLDPNILYYSQYHNDKKALFKIDLQSKVSELVFADSDYDVNGDLVYSRKTGDAIGVYHQHAEFGRYHFEQTNAVLALHRGLQQAFPKMETHLHSMDTQENIYLLYAEADNVPGVYYIGDRSNGQLSKLFTTYPALMGESLSQHELLTYTTRDGVEIEGYLTLPTKGEAPYPTVIHPHGGPGARDYDGFDYWTAFMSERGYAVFRPNFRGSQGYGYAFSQAQMQGWGLQMQDDLSDAARWLVQEGVAEKQKMCIVGASYGGYAALMATTKTPDLFACAVSFAGVGDLRKLVSRTKAFKGGKLIAKQQFGDDTDDLEARSPYYQANKIQTPILLVHGNEDRSVNVEQSRNFAEKLEDLGKAHKYVELASGDHYLSIQRNRHLFFAELDTFLKQYLN